MRSFFTISIIAASVFGGNLMAQPVVLNGSNLPPVGYTDSVAMTTSSMSPGAPGANVTWDFSSLPAVKGGKFTIVSPSSTPFASSFPSSTYAIKLDITGIPLPIYEYDIVSASKYEVIGSNISGGGGSDYTPNPKTIIPFPFNFNNVVVDTFEKVGSSPSSVTITYDGYGTLITPFGTYNNVIRSKRDFGGTDYFYEWYRVSPILWQVANYNNQTQGYTFLGTSPVGVEDLLNESALVKLYPNPMTNSSVISISSNIKEGMFVLTDISGRVVKKVALSNNSAILYRDDIPSGLYSYSILNNNNVIARGKLTIQ
jgi:hypothetical protein